MKLVINIFSTITICAAAFTWSPCCAQDMSLTQVLIEGQPWRLVADGLKFTEAPAVDAEGRLYYSDVPNGTVYRLNDNGEPEKFAQNEGNTSGLMCGPDGLLYACHYKSKQIVAYNPDGSFAVVATLPSCNDLVVSHDLHIYVTDPASQAVWLVRPGTEENPVKVADGFRPNGIILWQDEATLVVTDGESPVLRTFRVESDGSLQFEEKYYSPLQTAFGESVPHSDGMTVDNDGRLFVATSVGVQMFDPTGRLGGTIRKPQRAFLSNVVFGGKDFRTLYATTADKVYSRRVKPVGEPSIVRFAAKK